MLSISSHHHTRNDITFKASIFFQSVLKEHTGYSVHKCVLFPVLPRNATVPTVLALNAVLGIQDPSVEVFYFNFII